MSLLLLFGNSVPAIQAGRYSMMGVWLGRIGRIGEEGWGQLLSGKRNRLVT